jgi:hypothetical protein
VPDDECPVHLKPVINNKEIENENLCSACRYRLQKVMRTHNGMGNPKLLHITESYKDTCGRPCPL